MLSLYGFSWFCILFSIMFTPSFRKAGLAFFFLLNSSAEIFIYMKKSLPEAFCSSTPNQFGIEVQVLVFLTLLPFFLFNGTKSLESWGYQGIVTGILFTHLIVVVVFLWTSCFLFEHILIGNKVIMDFEMVENLFDEKWKWITMFQSCVATFPLCVK